ncbi:MAG: hypothetical protein TREMPRED_000528 [Tremellales sp. Tagirdzhanova-0007]|nr:MAG: hypothetical protein TREMPRED_000528 [Tremellales sp. Tagirdzhanova-0007]
MAPEEVTLEVLLDWICCFDWRKLLEKDEVVAIDWLSLAADPGLRFAIVLLEVTETRKDEVMLDPAKVGAGKLRLTLDVGEAITGETKGCASIELALGLILALAFASELSLSVKLPFAHGEYNVWRGTMLVSTAVTSTGKEMVDVNVGMTVM